MCRMRGEPLECGNECGEVLWGDGRHFLRLFGGLELEARLAGLNHDGGSSCS